MTVRLTVDRAAWHAHVFTAAAGFGQAVVPVVKGNGYGFGRPVLHQLVPRLHAGADGHMVCVGTVHELHDVPPGLTPVVLTPTLGPPPDEGAATEPPILTVGSLEHVQALAGWRGRVIVKLASSMRRYGATPHELPALLAATAAAGLQVHAFGLHLPLAGDDHARLAEIEAWLPHLETGTGLWVSHLTPASFTQLCAAQPGHAFRTRVGTALWHGAPRGSFVQLTADVLHSQPVLAGETAGYFGTATPCDGTLLAIGAGSAHGVAPLDDADPARRSPFHFHRHRLVLLERPHMHTTMAIVPAGAPCPLVGDRVDVQRPLIGTLVDEVEWV